MGTYVPPEWPAGVHPPGSEDFESTAVGWLLDVVPPDYRLHGVLRRYPIALATMARYHAKACVDGARQGYRTARTELAGALPPHAVDTVLAAYRKEGARLAAIASAVDLVERALRGEVFTPEMGVAGSGFAGPSEPTRPDAAGDREAPGDRGAAEARGAARGPDTEAARTRGAAGTRGSAGRRGAAGEPGAAGTRGAARERDAEAAGGRGPGRQAGQRRNSGGELAGAGRGDAGSAESGRTSGRGSAEN